MSNIDDFFKDTLNNKGMNYEDSYWESMEAIIDQKKKKKPAFFIKRTAIILIGLFSCLMVFIGIQTYNSSQGAATVKNAPANYDRNETTREPNGNTVSNSEKTPVVKEGETNVIVSEKTPGLQTISAPITNNTPKETQGPNTPNLKSQLPNIPVDFREETATRQKQEPISFISSSDKNLFESRNLNIGEIPERINVRGKLQLQNKWEYYLSAGYEFDVYSREKDRAPLKADEKTLNKAGYNINFSARKNHWGIKSGVGILQLTELTNYVTLNKSYITSTSYRMVDANYGQTPGGTKIALIKKYIDTTTTVTTSVNNPNSKVQFIYLKIPVLATYEIKLNRFKLFAEAGINISVLTQKKGNYTSLENNQYKLVNSSNSKDFNPFLFQAGSAIGFKYSLTNSLFVYSSYGYSQSLNSMMKSYSQKPKVNFISAGLEIRL